MTLKQLVSKLVKSKTTSDRPEEIKKCFDFIRTQLEKHSNVYIRDYLRNGKQSLVASFSKSKKFDCILVGHLDVVPAEDAAFEPRIEDDRLYGRGTSDMKGPDAAMILAFLKMAEMDDPPDIALMLTGDEEVGGFDGVKYMVEEGYKADCVVVPDGGDNFEIVLAEKGVYHAKITAKGKTAHGSRPWLGENAIEKLIGVYKRLKTEFPLPKGKDRWGPTLNLGKIKGGDAANKVPDSAYMHLDIRYTEKFTKADIRKKVKKVIQGASNVDMKELVTGACMHTDAHNEYLQKFKEIAEEKIGKEVKLVKEHGASDARFFSEKGVPVIICKPVSSPAHIDGEWIDLESLKTYQEIVEEFIISR